MEQNVDMPDSTENLMKFVNFSRLWVDFSKFLITMRVISVSKIDLVLDYNRFYWTLERWAENGESLNAFPKNGYFFTIK